MRTLMALVCLALALSVGANVATAADGKGSVQKSWVSTSSGGPPESAVDVTESGRVYANFTWGSVPRAGQSLRIAWRDPSGALRALWKDKTVAADKRGTRIYASISIALLRQTPGTWRAILTVGGSTRSVKYVRAVAPVAQPPVQEPEPTVVTPTPTPTPPVTTPVATPPPVEVPVAPSGFCDTHACIPSFNDGHGTIVQCVDGMWSHSGGIQGACSGHGGVLGG